MEQAKYNGWTNRETWLVNLWLNNDISYYDEFSSIINSDLNVSNKTDMVKGLIKDHQNASEASLTTDLINDALDKVNWLEIVEFN